MSLAEHQHSPERNPSDRYFCRNPRCRSKLPAPVESKHHAFCCRGCHAIYYRHRCLVCEEPMQRTGDHQRFRSGHQRCKSEHRQFPRAYDRWHAERPKTSEGTSSAREAPPNVDSTRSFWPDRAGRSWSWTPFPGDDDDWQLLNRAGREVGRIRQEGTRYWVAFPRCIPELPLESLDQAKLRAVNLALWLLPSASTKSRTRTRNASPIALQFGVPLDVIRGGLRSNARGQPSSPLGAALDAITEEGKR